jgi:hypothetical protein
MRRFLQSNPFLAIGILGALLMGLWIAFGLSPEAGVGRGIFLLWRTLAAPIHLATNVVGRYTETWPTALDALAALAVGILPYLVADWLLRRRNFLLSGIVAGASASVLFTGLHHAAISDIWFAIVPMVLAGAICGLCLAWTYQRLFPMPTAGSWVGFNGAFMALYVVLGAVSLLVYEPVAAAAALLAANEPPSELIRAAMPLSVGIALVGAATMWWRWGRSTMDAVALLITHALLMGLLGLNMSVVGLVQWTGEAVAALAGFVGLLVALAAGFTGVLYVIERARFGSGRHLSVAYDPTMPPSASVRPTGDP